MIAIHHKEKSFSDKWIQYCQLYHVPFKTVNCLNSNIMSQLHCCDGLMWHWFQYDSKAILFARQLTYSLEQVGKRVFPDSMTAWHFDDKLGQKYLLEAIGAPLVPAHIFFSRKDAKVWIKKTKLPTVFKLRCGAGAINVKLVRTQQQAEKLIRRAFGRGFAVNDRISSFHDRTRHFQRNKTLKNIFHVFKGLVRIVYAPVDDRLRPRERGYIYFQDFIPDMDSDIRVVVIGKRAFAIRRAIREGDFRASGSGLIDHDPTKIPMECIKTAFDLNRKLNTQCIAFDFAAVGNDIYLFEISYGFDPKGYAACPGFWDDALNWHEGSFYPEWFMIEDFLQTIAGRNT